MRINISGVFVNDQERALRFYTETLGFQTKHDVPAGDHRWITVVSPEDPGGTELALEPDNHPAVRPFVSALVADGIPSTSFEVSDIEAEYTRLKGLGVRFTQEPKEFDSIMVAIFDDTCGNLIMMTQGMIK